MAYKGPAPKNNSVTRHKPKTPGMEVIQVEEFSVTPRKLFSNLINPMDKRPGKEPEDKKLCSEALKFLDSLINYPVNKNLQEAQWLDLRISVMMYDMLIKTGEIKYMKEVRSILKDYFISPESLIRARKEFAITEEKEQKAADAKRLSAWEMYR